MSKNVLVLHLNNNGRVVAVIFKIVLYGDRINRTAVATPNLGREVTLEPGERAMLTFQLEDIEIEHNHTYAVEIYTRARNVYKVYLRAR